MFRFILTGLTVVTFVWGTAAHALEWEDAFWTLQAGGSYAPAHEEYPDAIGFTVAPSYILPVFVEGHTRIALSGRYQVHRYDPSEREGHRGAWSNTLGAEAALMRRFRVADNAFWLGGGLSLSARYLGEHYEWVDDGTSLIDEEIGSDWDEGSHLTAHLEVPISPLLSAHGGYRHAVYGEQPSYWLLELGVAF